jgi:hypothetical protein
MGLALLAGLSMRVTRTRREGPELCWLAPDFEDGVKKEKEKKRKP